MDLLVFEIFFSAVSDSLVNKLYLPLLWLEGRNRFRERLERSLLAPGLRREIPKKVTLSSVKTKEFKIRGEDSPRFEIN